MSASATTAVPVIAAHETEKHAQEIESLRAAFGAAAKETELLQKSFEGYKDQTNLGLALIGILLALVGILLPILTYVTSILPATRVVGEARRTLDALDEKFLELKRKHKTQEIEQAIEQLEGADAVRRASAATYLGVNAHFDFTDKQIGDICKHITGIAQVHKLQLLAIVSGRDNLAVTHLLKDVLQGPQGLHYVQAVVRQMTVPAGAPLRTELKRWLSTPEAQPYLGHALTVAAMTSRQVLEEWINDRDFLDTFDAQARASALTVLRSTSDAYGVSDLVEGSILAKSFAGQVICFIGTNNGRLASVSPSEANFAFVYEDGVQVGSLIPNTPQFREAATKYKPRRP
jgi:hypothetical protein